ncbi:TlpA family protein disulfide reductase [Streptomyces sp. NPDC050504]|uniref:TlpA family protein disulfide reductase n=1 Tax=Streptomyces sp. NPDC050504 TaxID=3365618 RepID=UPI00378D2746
MSLSRAPRRRLAALSAGAALAALTLSACTNDNPSGGGDTNFVTGKSGISTVDKGDRKDAPTLDGETLEGKQLNTDDYKGKIVVLNVWGSWCTPCRAEAKNLTAVAKATKPKGVEFIGINTRDAEKLPAIKFEEDYGVTYPSLHDPAGKLLLRFPKGTLNLQVIPSTLVIDRDGKIAARIMGAASEDNLRKMIDPLIAEK